MKTQREFLDRTMDLGTIFDDLFDYAGIFLNENTDYYPGFSYPPMNVFLTGDKSLNFEFALAGFDEKNISLSFLGDYMIFSARIENGYSADQYRNGNGQHVHYLKRRLKLKDIEKQKYYVPMDKYDQDKVQAVFRNGILKVSVPPRQNSIRTECITIAIVKEGI